MPEINPYGINKIRNFCIIAHIDHGKSTLADRLLEITHTVSSRELHNQFLDSNPIERERGVTIKAKAVAMHYSGYDLNLIDTPGHVDFSYEVLKSLRACEGALLLVDATQGVQAQTVANALLAKEAHLTIIPAINKIDHPSAQPDIIKEEMKITLGIKPEEVLLVSAKNGTNADKVLDAVVERIKPPTGDATKPLQALIFDSVYDDYRGVIIYIRLMHGQIKVGDEIIMMRTNLLYKVEEVGKFRPKMFAIDKLSAGEVGYVIAGIRNIRDVKIGDTITHKDNRCAQPLPGYQEPLSMVFAGFYPAGDTDFKTLKRAIERLSLNDASFSFEPETSEALGLGFRCGFLGLFHMEIVKERLEREEDVELVQTAPNVPYEVTLIERGHTKTIRINNPADLPDDMTIKEIKEPVVRVSMVIPTDCIGIIMQLSDSRRGKTVRTEYISPTRVILTYDLPLGEIIYDFYDKLKSATRGYATMDYSFKDYEAADLVKLRILVADSEVDAFSSIVHRDEAESKGRRIIQTLRKEIPKHLFQIALQASIGKRVVARENISPLAKHVTGKCYGGDITRKRKLWAKQKEGKKRMKAVGRVEIPQEAFLAVLGGSVAV
ncbi:MAG: elongation factor 4 [Planctomycetes bacterium]|nr:elongation factor 4 [Planctomycetota bacterium]